MSVIVITGASSGIGRAVALRAARAGYDVIAIGRDASALDSLAERIRNEGGSVVTARYDVADPANARAIVTLAHHRFGRIDVLLNNAGHVAIGPLSQQSDDALRAQFGTHAIGPIALIREALPSLRRAQGHVFMVGSGVARVPVGGLGAYPPSKAATRSATTILRRELKPDGIAVTYVDPGVVDTAFMTRAGMPGAPAPLLAAPDVVARKIIAAIRTRPRVVNAVPWQTAAVALAELFPALTEFVIARNPGLVGTQPPALAAAAPAQRALTPGDEAEAAVHVPDAPPKATFESAIAPLRRRMERVKLGEHFVRGLLQEEGVIDPDEVALRWAGMPNKNERAATVEVLEALAQAGFLERDGARFRVVRVAD